MKKYIVVATHKKYEIIPQDPIYHIVEVGAKNRENHFSLERDDIGKDNISEKNSSYCELTALYWAWKNTEFDILGLCHYRRYFSKNKHEFFDNFKNIIDAKTIDRLLNKADVIVPKIIKLNKTIYQHSIAHYDDGHMDITRKVISSKYPEYLNAFDTVMNSKKAHFFNMFIGKKDFINNYLKWLFSILSEVEKIYVFDCPDPRSKRVFGYISESLLDVYLLTNNIKYIERDLVYLERPNLIYRVLHKLKRKIK